jgi:RimJ/RimL family protein N-acetyltransferase
LKYLREVVYDRTVSLAEDFDGLLRELAAADVFTRRVEEAGREKPEHVLYICGEKETCSIAEKSDAAFVTYMTDAKGSQCIIEGFFEITSDFCERMLMRKLRRPWVIARTDRLIIREFKEDDDLDVFEGRWKDNGYIREYIDYQYRLFGYGIWALESKEEKKIIGKAGLFNSSMKDGLELGYDIAKPYRRRGYALEACTEICRYARQILDASRIYVVTSPDNTASIQLAQKLKNAENVDIIVSLDYTHH